MGIKKYLPSAQFTLMVSAVALSGGLVVAAQYVTTPHAPAELVATTSNQATTNTAWQDTLAQIQAQNPLNTLPPAPNPTAVSDLLAAAQTSNVTNTVARTLLINLSQAKAQGLGGDTPTQDQLVSQALAQINQDRGNPSYSQSDLTLSANTPEANRAYGNAVITILSLHPGASVNATLIAIGGATDTGDAAKLAPLAGIQKEYEALTRELLAVPVPPTLAPLHLQVVNDLSSIAGSYDNMKQVLTDPLRGLAALDQYQTLTGELQRLFINIAQAFNKNGILFTDSEPGQTWALLMPQS